MAVGSSSVAPVATVPVGKRRAVFLTPRRPTQHLKGQRYPGRSCMLYPFDAVKTYPLNRLALSLAWISPLG